MLVCEYCLEAIRSHGEPVPVLDTLFVDETDPEESRCEWCEESGNDHLHEIKFR